ncbi:MAG: metallophosphoesterase [Acidobacteria bacterium]|nr:MAG: metallophosphoesterase [Acidobacteriota bacterium]
MRAAAIYDVHGNLPALEAVLEDIHREGGADLVVVGGDVLPGPFPREVLARLLGLEIPVRFIRGNGDREVLAWRMGVETSALPEHVRDVLRWTGAELRPEDEILIAGWPATLDLGVPGIGEVLFCHATPKSDNEVFTRLTPEERLRPVFESVGAGLVVCGHTHMQFDRTVGRTRVVNAGSVGMPFGEPGADYLLLGPDVCLRHVAYDLELAAACIRATAYPHAADFADRYILHPPREDEMLRVFTKL